MSQQDKQEKIPNLLIRNSIDFNSSQDPGSCDTIQVDKIDVYISHKIDEMLKRQLSSLSNPHHKIVELLNGFFVDFENEKKETQKIISLKNNEVEGLKTENFKLMNKNLELEAQIKKLQQENSEIDMLKHETTRLTKENSKKSQEIECLITRYEDLLNLVKAKDEENSENSKNLTLVLEENKKLKELKEQMIKYYKRKVNDLKKQCLAMAGKAKRVIANIERTALNKEIQFSSPSVEERKSEEVKKIRLLEKDNFLFDGTLERNSKKDTRFDTLRLEAKSSSEIEKFPEKERRENFSYQPGTSTMKILENPYQIKDFKREKKTHSCDFKETSPFKPQSRDPSSKFLKH